MGFSIYPTILMTVLCTILYFTVNRLVPLPKRQKAMDVGAVVAAVLTMVILAVVLRFTGIDLLSRGKENENYGTSTYTIAMTIPICITIPIYIYSRIYPNKIPSNGTWYCEELQVGLCFDESGSSFVVKDQKNVPCRLEIRSKSGFIYLFSNDLFEACVFSGKFISRTKKQMRIEDRDSHCVYNFAPIDHSRTGDSTVS